MKNIYRTIVLLGTAAILSSSCSDWLNVYPSDQVKEEYLFESGDGYRAALNGIYRKMASWSLYGSNLKWGLIDAWGQVYDITLCADHDGGREMKLIEQLKFNDNQLTPTTDRMWTDAWNVVANCNELAQQAEKADPSLFADGDFERKMILGEAIALRAYLQFDLLRIYAPSPAMNPGERTFIPYVNVYPSYVSNRQTVSYCLNQIISDLKQAQDILLKVDEKVSWDTRFKKADKNELVFKSSRGFRLNYYAVTAELARVYLYAGMLDEAYQQADIIIKKKEYFSAITKKSKAIEAIQNGNVKMFDDVIFALYSPTNLVDWDYKINHAWDGDSYKESFLGLNNDMARARFDEDLNSDWRICYQMKNRGYYSDYPDYTDYGTLKYYQQPKSYKHAEINNALIPMFRMSEVYYIAAEAIYKQDLKKAKDFLKAVKQGRGASTSKLESLTKEDFMDVLVNDALREFMGEGQTFFMYKRLKQTMKGRKEILALEENMVLPLPESESNI